MSVPLTNKNENGRWWPSWRSAFPGSLRATGCLLSAIFTGVPNLLGIPGRQISLDTSRTPAPECCQAALQGPWPRSCANLPDVGSQERIHGISIWVHCMGSTAMPTTRISQCRCAPLERPVLPE